MLRFSVSGPQERFASALTAGAAHGPGVRPVPGAGSAAAEARAEGVDAMAAGAGTGVGWEWKALARPESAIVRISRTGIPVACAAPDRASGNGSP
ncbi:MULTISPECIES: hypothetical protein [Streptomyces]|uniref:Uncharacterized protein n=2 Tax=Streptomyces griseus TaxID=1911 RepID=B1VLZ4_STRGG|nr:hypothetical protein [Streptomyces griseus]MBW3709772.1 hypothetical protein [Streptomyces griseus]SEE21464.1 hypothetical protein SAMN04490359_2216 [Streptomyces griseus]SQA26648.1 Uncharacterised protein [Streptomyces griseus]BAG16895.1 hypothetical protein SGR_66t [Streptomyces griseus subsp. griseus NBRC 13350]BAG23900.1 hypothetical protein SGR_7073t [Streptomyces griseus subsp. griseus NBRC 13350]